jgi:uncharacterized protein YutE (UPF0331/DUF86 family)
VTDAERLASKLALIETRLRELRTVGRPSLIAQDILQEPATNRELFALLARAGILAVELGHRLQAMAGFRNVLVHGYDAVNLGIVRDIVESRLGDLDDFVAAIRSYLARG